MGEESGQGQGIIEDSIQRLLASGHGYSDIINVYSFERFNKFVLVSMKHELQQSLAELQTLAMVIGGAFSKEGGKSLQTYVKKVDGMIRKCDGQIRGISQGIHESNAIDTASIQQELMSFSDDLTTRKHRRRPKNIE